MMQDVDLLERVAARCHLIMFVGQLFMPSAEPHACPSHPCFPESHIAMERRPDDILARSLSAISPSNVETVSIVGDGLDIVGAQQLGKCFSNCEIVVNQVRNLMCAHRYASETTGNSKETVKPRFAFRSAHRRPP